MKQLFLELADLLEAGQDAVLVSVVASSGSAPGGLGARMLVGPHGRAIGTVGGGQVEHRAEGQAVQALAARRSGTEAFTLRHGGAGDIGMICGGDVTLWYQYIAASAPAAAFARRAAAAFGADRDAWLLCLLRPEADAELALYTKEGGLDALHGQASAFAGLTEKGLKALAVHQPVNDEVDGLPVYSEPLVRAGRVVVFGGGHVAQALVPLLSTLGFATVVLDDRPEFANRKQFPTAGEVILGDFGDIAAHLTLTPRDYLVIVTRGHAADFEVQRQVLGSPHAYVGVIGSRAKTLAVSQRLLAAGIPQAAIDAIHTPIGLSIGAVTPAEIAVAIAGELIAVRAGHPAGENKRKEGKTDE